MIWDWLRGFADAFLGKVPGKTGQVDTATRMAMDADFTVRDAPRPVRDSYKTESEIDQIEELQRILSADDSASSDVPPPVSRVAGRARPDGSRRKGPLLRRR